MSIIVTLIVITIAAFLDLKYRRIPNLLTAPALVLGLILNFYYSGFTGLGKAFIAVFVMVVVLIIPFILRGLGAGDIKLLAAVAALNGLEFSVNVLLYTAVTGGIIAVLISIIKGRLILVSHNVFSMLQTVTSGLNKIPREQHVPPVLSEIRFPYGIAIFIGTILAYWQR